MRGTFMFSLHVSFLLFAICGAMYFLVAYRLAFFFTLYNFLPTIMMVIFNFCSAMLLSFGPYARLRLFVCCVRCTYVDFQQHLHSFSLF